MTTRVLTRLRRFYSESLPFSNLRRICLAGLWLAGALAIWGRFAANDDPRKGPYEGKTVVFGMVERGGQIKTMKVPEATGRTLRPIMLKAINLERSRLVTDGSPAYRRIKDYLPHDAVDHEVEYVRGDIHTHRISTAIGVT